MVLEGKAQKHQAGLMRKVTQPQRLYRSVIPKAELQALFVKIRDHSSNKKQDIATNPMYLNQRDEKYLSTSLLWRLKYTLWDIGCQNNFSLKWHPILKGGKFMYIMCQTVVYKHRRQGEQSYATAKHISNKICGVCMLLKNHSIFLFYTFRSRIDIW